MHTANHTVNSLRIAMRKALRPYGMNFVDDLENSGRFKIITKAEAASVFGVGREYTDASFNTIEEVRDAGVRWDKARRQWYKECQAEPVKGGAGHVDAHRLLEHEAANKKRKMSSIDIERIEPTVGDPRIYFGYSKNLAKELILSEARGESTVSTSSHGPMVDSIESNIESVINGDRNTYGHSDEITTEKAGQGIEPIDSSECDVIDEISGFNVPHNYDDYSESEAYYRSSEDLAAAEYYAEYGGAPSPFSPPRKPGDDSEISKDSRKIFLNVPYSEKDEAKKLGAKWDKNARCWYSENESDCFSKWVSNTTNDTGSDPELLHSASINPESGSNDILAFYNRSDRIAYIIADAIPAHTNSAALRGIALHEIAVHALNLCRGTDEFHSLIDSFEKLKTSGDGCVLSAFSAAKKANPDMDDESISFKEEALGYYVEENPSMPISRIFLCLFRDCLRSIGSGMPVMSQTKIMRWADNISGDDVLYMAHKAMKSAPEMLVRNNTARILSTDDPFAREDVIRKNSSATFQVRDFDDVGHVIRRESLNGISKRLNKVDSETDIKKTRNKHGGAGPGI